MLKLGIMAQQKGERHMNVIAINGSARKRWNTAQLLEKALEGAAEKGATTKLVHLYDLDFKGCISCFGCKQKGGKSYGRCAMRDDLTPLLDEIHAADAVIMGTPVYLASESSGFRAFAERLVFQYLVYANPPGSLFPRRIPAAVVYTMGAPEVAQKAMGYDHFIEQNRRHLEMILGSCETLVSYDTLQFDDYAKYESGMFDPDAKMERHREVFPQDKAKAKELGYRLLDPIQ